MTPLAPWILVLGLLPAAALKPPPIPTPGPARDDAAPSTSVAETLPAEQRERYASFVQKCGRCHAPEKALGEPYTAEQWDDYLRKKNKRSGAAITERQLEEIGAFLRYWSTARK